jgi:hypothetical protein
MISHDNNTRSSGTSRSHRQKTCFVDVVDLRCGIPLRDPNNRWIEPLAGEYLLFIYEIICVLRQDLVVFVVHK